MAITVQKVACFYGARCSKDRGKTKPPTFTASYFIKLILTDSPKNFTRAVSCLFTVKQLFNVYYNIDYFGDLFSESGQK